MIRAGYRAIGTPAASSDQEETRAKPRAPTSEELSADWTEFFSRRNAAKLNKETSEKKHGRVRRRTTPEIFSTELKEIPSYPRSTMKTQPQ